MLNQRSDKVELLRIAEAVAIEKSIDKEIILNSMETAIQKAAKTRFGSENDIRAKIDRESGNITLHKVLKIVEKPENLDIEISYNIWEFYQNFLIGINIPIEEKSSHYYIDRTSVTWASWEQWCQEVIWYGNKKGAYLYPIQIIGAQFLTHESAMEREIAGHY